MKRIEPNLLLAVATAFALMLMVVTASLSAPMMTALKYVGLAIACSAGFVLLNKAFMAARKRKPRVLISAEHPGVVILAAIFPMVATTAPSEESAALSAASTIAAAPANASRR